MSTGILVVIIVAAVVIVALVAMALQTAMRRRRLQQRFGSEYERTVESEHSRRAAEHELSEREQRHQDLKIRPLPSTVRSRYARDWNSVQEHFVDSPDRAVGEADQLVVTLMSERGYPTEGYEQQARDLSVEHAETLKHYRIAHEINGRVGGGDSSTEEMRNAMVHYRAMFEELLRDDTASSGGSRS
jgi:FtsZ-interacting cell division protein ZipA